MCGLMGVIMGGAKRTPGHLGMIRMAYETMMLLGQSRGTHAAGVALIDRMGNLSWSKKKGPAVQFIRTRQYMDVMSNLTAGTNLIMGHTRYATDGDPSSMANNHPIKAGDVVMTHNGVIFNANELFDYYEEFQRDGEVDSEIIARLAEDCLNDGVIDTLELSGRLAELEGNLSCVIASVSNPNAIVLVKGDRPLEAVYVPAVDALFYSSVLTHIERALDEVGFYVRKVATLAPNTVYTADCSLRLKLRRSAKLVREDPDGLVRVSGMRRWYGVEMKR